MPQVSAAALVLRPAFVNFARVAHRVHRRETRFCCPALDSSLFIFHKFTKSVNILKTFLPHCSHLAVWSRVCPCSSWVQPRDHPTILLYDTYIIYYPYYYYYIEGSRRRHAVQCNTVAPSPARGVDVGRVGWQSDGNGRLARVGGCPC